MKKLIKIAFAFVLAFGLCTTAVKAEETYMTVTSYTETFKPVGEDAELTASVVATAGSDGYVYLIKTYKKRLFTAFFFIFGLYCFGIICISILLIGTTL